jgi:DNA polymerase-1
VRRLLLIDGQPLIYRSFYGGGDDAGYRSDGLPTGAVSGFMSRLWDLLREDLKDHRFTHAAVVFDPPGRNWRYDVAKTYKANREEKPIDMVVQLEIAKQLVEPLGLKLIEQRGYEADDMIASYARANEEAGGETVIVTSDKDLYGLVRPGVVIYSPMSKAWITEKEVEAKFGVPPRLVREVQALSGDDVDNIIGLPGIGPVKAAKLVKMFGSFEGLLFSAADAPEWKLKRKDGTSILLPEALAEMKDQLRQNYELVRLEDWAPLRVPLGALEVKTVNAPALLSALRALEIIAFARRVAFAYYLRADEAKPCPRMLAFAEEMQEWRTS